MIITVTMNPAIDKTVEIEKLLPGGLNRIQKVEYDAGGKGINVSKTICALGGKTIATGFLGGNSGKTIKNVLDDLRITNDFIWVEGETRTNTKVVEKNGNLTELNEPGPVIGQQQTEQLMSRLEEYTDENTLVILAGSVPKGVDKDIYAQMIRLVHKKGGKVLLDADGELFRRALSAGPDMIKPNAAELEEYAGMEPDAGEEQLLKAARALKKQGIENIVVSMGKQGAFLAFPGYEVKCPAVEVKVRSTVGAGDAMVAALAYSWEQGLSREETVKLTMAVSAGAVTTVGTKPPSKELIEKLKENVKIEILHKCCNKL